MEEIKTHTQFIGISKEIAVQFIYAPSGYNVIKYSLEGHTMKKIGRLNSFNKLKSLNPWRKHGNLVELFTKLLKAEKWDFKKFPNPYAFLVIYDEIIENLDFIKKGA